MATTSEVMLEIRKYIEFNKKKLWSDFHQIFTGKPIIFCIIFKDEQTFP